MKSNLKPCEDRIIVRLISVDEQTSESGSIIIVNTQPNSDPFTQGIVVAVGSSAPHFRIPAKVGDRVLVPTFGGNELRAWHTKSDDLHKLYKFEEIAGVFSDDTHIDA